MITRVTVPFAAFYSTLGTVEVAPFFDHITLLFEGMPTLNQVKAVFFKKLEDEYEEDETRQHYKSAIETLDCVNFDQETPLPIGNYSCRLHCKSRVYDDCVTIVQLETHKI